jgi:PAS domain S-box-containing protein
LPGTPLSIADAEALLALIPHVACVLDAQGRISWTNTGWSRVFGAAPSDDEAFLAIVNPDDTSLVTDALERCAAGASAEPFVARCTHCDGSELWIEWRLAPHEEDRLIVSGRDVSRERRRGDVAGEQRMLAGDAEQIAGLGSWRLDLADGSLFWSPEMYRVFGVDPSVELDLAQVTSTAIHPDDRAMIEEINKAVLADGVPRPAQYRILLPDGSVKWVNAQGRQVVDPSGRVVALVGFVQDITERTETEEALRASEARYRSIIDGMQDAYFRADIEGRLTLANQAAARMYGFESPSEMIGIGADSLYADTGERDDVIQQLRRDGVVADRVGRGRRRDGNTFWVSLNVDLAWDANGAAVGTEGFARDVTDRIVAEEALRDSLSLLRATLESTADGILVVSRDGKVAGHNQQFAKLWGIPKRLLAEADDAALLDFVTGRLSDPRSFIAGVEYLYEHPEEESFDVLEFADGRVFERYSRPQTIEDRIVGRVWSFRDVTQRAQVERALRASEKDLMDAQAIARIGSYVYDLPTDSWTSSQTMDDIFGIDESYPRNLESWTALVHDEDRETMSRYFAEEVVGKRLPFDKEYRVTRHNDGKTIWVHGHGGLEDDDEGRPIRAVGAIQDVTLRHRADKELRTTNESLERMVYEVAEAMGRMIEIRDQYTKGHQERTARLAKAIAVEMGLPASDVTAVEMAAVVHDIGKLSVPAEILSRPMRLSDLEMSLVREHPRNSFEILKDIPFPWPVARIVLQHHERMDGSGYPDGTVGEAILPLARVLAVADVVEAMATHRPYRPALGLDAAIAELRECAEKYDPDTVAACVRLYERGEIDL